MNEYLNNPQFLIKILHSCPVCFLIQEDGVVSYATPFVNNFLGIKPGDKLSDFFHGVGDDFNPQPEKDVNNFQYSDSVVIKTAFGDFKKMELQLYSYEHEGKAILLTWLNDISRLNSAEDALRLVREQVREQMRASNDTLAKLSYETRKSLDSILGLSSLLRDGENTEQQIGYIDTLTQSAKGLLEAVDEIFVSDKDSDEHKPFCMRAVLAEVESNIRKRLEGRNLEYTVICQSDVPERLSGSPKSIETVLITLIKNSIGFTRKGGITVKVSEYDRMDDDVTLLFSVADTGCGMKKEQVDALFPQFASEDNGDDSVYRNGGLGLATAQTLVDFMRGRMWCDSVHGSGTTIYFTVSCKLSGESEESDFYEHTGEINFHPEDVRILVVDDNRINRTVASELLKRQGFTVETAESGTEAVDIIKADGNFNLILMDVYMPDMDGGTATKIIRSMYPRIPIVALTACAMPGDKEMCLALGMNDYFVKPFDVPSFIRLIKKWVS